MGYIMRIGLSCILLVVLAATAHGRIITNEFAGNITKTFYSEFFPDEIIKVGDQVRGNYVFTDGAAYGYDSLVVNLEIGGWGGAVDVFFSYEYDEDMLNGLYPDVIAAGLESGFELNDNINGWYEDNYNTSFTGFTDQDVSRLAFDSMGNGTGYLEIGTGGSDTLFDMDSLLSSPGYFTLDYTIESMHTPEPASILFFCIAIGGLLVNRLRKRGFKLLKG